jgi:hypothetical protein
VAELWKQAFGFTAIETDDAGVGTKKNLKPGVALFKAG